jgi:signal transduction histidine kinase/DNA-binding response OmpR family regulator/ligand-binding sensor domain-containing protein
LRTFVQLACWIFSFPSCIGLCLAADPVYALRHLGVDQGLTQSHVTAFAQDRAGFVWVGTAVGLNRYDGHTFQTFLQSPGQAGALSGNGIYSLLADARGRVWVGTESGLDLFQPADEGFRRYLEDSARDRLRVRALDAGEDGDIWAVLSGDESNGWYVRRLNPATGEARRFSFPRVSTGVVVAIRVIGRDRILAVVRNPQGRTPSRGFAVVLLDSRTGNWSEFAADLASSITTGMEDRDLTLAWDGEGTGWIGAPGPYVFRIDMKGERLLPQRYEPALASESGLVSHVVAAPDGQVWVIPTYSSPRSKAATNPIYALDPRGAAPRRALLRPSGPCDLGRGFVISSLIDRTGVLWLGLSGAGMCLADLKSGMFSHLHENAASVPLSNNFVRASAKLADGSLWVGTRVGIDILDRARTQLRHVRPVPGDATSLADKSVTAILQDRRGAVWVGTAAGGLHYAPTPQPRFRRYQHSASNPGSISSDHVTALREDREGVLWAGTHGGGLNRFDSAERRFTVFRRRAGDPDSCPGDFLNALLEDSRGEFWVATEDGGLARFDRRTGRFHPVAEINSRTTYLLSLAEDPRHPGVLWVGTLRDGVARYDTASHQAQWFHPGNSLLPSPTVYSLVSDGADSIWAGTNSGLARIDAASREFRIFGVDQGLQSMEFNTLAGSRAADGEILLGGVGGLNAFYPANITQNTAPGQLLIASVRAFDRDGSSTSSPYRSVFRAGVEAGGQTHSLPASSRDLIFSYVLLHFADPERNTYLVKLDGFDADWRDVGPAREITYTNLNPGEYRFRVRAVTSRGVRNPQEAVYAFSIAAPVYQRPWFLALAAFSALAAAFRLYRWRIRNLDRARERLESQVAARTGELTEALEVIESQTRQLRESDALKSRFLTNVSHDFRTPLTITLGALADIRNGLYGPLDARVSAELDLVLRNERRLLRLVNQLIDIARMESGKLRLQVAEHNLAALAEEAALLLQPLARHHRVELRAEPSGDVLAWCDADWINEVITNLLLNAIRFTPPGGLVIVETSREPGSGRPTLSVLDSGAGIPEHELPLIFERFYRAETTESPAAAGLGIGLSLVKEIVDLHHGEVHAQSTPGSGSTFRVFLPAGPAAFDPADLRPGVALTARPSDLAPLVRDLLASNAPLEDEPEAAAEGLTLLVAEDNRDLRQYLLLHLRTEYRVLLAASGDEALRLVREEQPDLVIADIMMPGLDGISLCREIRRSPDTDFIPVILLTAKSTTTDRLEGLDSGADDYLAKPFEIAELRARIRNLLDSRLRLRTQIAARLSLDHAIAQTPVPESNDALFLRRAYDVLREHASRDTFSVAQFADELSMSRMHLYRRLHEIVGKSPTEFLMDYRLERAAELLAARTGNVSEIAYGLGFKSLSHFTRRFRERFGCPPSSYGS